MKFSKTRAGQPAYKNESNMIELKTYIETRIEALKSKHDYDYGFLSREEIIGGLHELKMLARIMRIEVGPVHSFDIPDWLKR